ncbi:MAG TPA: cbb3-type cytochrome c oxidase subunit I, partial [Xanthobacteraceae bacterium]
AVGFLFTFTIGGVTGVMLAVPPADFMVHNSLFLVAHFHNVIIAGVLFAALAGYTYWFPKAFGFRLEESWGKAAFWCWLIGFYLAFMPLYVTGLMGMTRRLQHYDVAAWYPWMLVAEAGIILVWIGIACLITQLVVSFRHQEELRDVTGDPWNGRSLEWSTASPPPAFNFAVLPRIEGSDAYWTTKERALRQHVLADEPAYHDVELPRNSATGFVCAFFATFLGFAMIWHIWWLAVLSFIGAYATFVAFAWRDRTEYLVPTAEVARIDRANRSARLAALAHLGAAE